MIGDFFLGVKEEQFEEWLKKVVGRDNRFAYLLIPENEEERADFINTFLKGCLRGKHCRKNIENTDNQLFERRTK